MVPAMAATSKQLSGTLQSAPGPSVLEVGLGAFAVLQLVTGIFMALAPHAFFKYIGPFGAINVHYLRDLATFYVADGVALAIAVRSRSWRVPVLALTTIQFVLHSINHLVDINKAHPLWTGYFDFFSIAAASVLLIWLLRVALNDSAHAQQSVTGAG